MSRLESVLEDHKQMLIRYYPEEASILGYDEALLHYTTLADRDKIKNSLDALLNKANLLRQSDAKRLLINDIGQRIRESEVVLKGNNFFDHFTLPIYQFYAILDYLKGKHEANANTAEFIKEAYLKILEGTEAEIKDILALDLPMVGGLKRYDMDYTAKALELVRYFDKIFSIDNADRTRGFIQDYRTNYPKRWSKKWVIGLDNASKLYGEDVMALAQSAKKELNLCMENIKAELAGTISGEISDDSVFEYMGVLSSEEIKGDILGYYHARTEEILAELKKIGFDLPDMEISWGIDNETSGVYVAPIVIGKGDRVHAKVYINTEEPSVRTIHGVQNTIIHEIVAHAAQEVYTRKNRYRQFANDLISLEGYAVHMERLCSEALGQAGKLTKKEKLFSMFEELRMPIRLLAEVATLTGDRSVLEGIPGSGSEKDVYREAYRLYSIYRYLSLDDAKDEIKTYVGTSPYMSAYFRGMMEVRKILGEHFAAEGNETVNKVNRYMKIGAMPIWYIEKHM